MGRDIFLVGIGGFAGSVARYLVYLIFAGQNASAFPYATFSVNILGCFLIGAVFGLGERNDLLTPELRLLLATGFCGGFTTFSAYSIESVGLMQRGEFGFAAAYIVLSVVAGVAATFGAIALLRAL